MAKIPEKSPAFIKEKEMLSGAELQKRLANASVSAVNAANRALHIAEKRLMDAEKSRTLSRETRAKLIETAYGAAQEARENAQRILDPALQKVMILSADKLLNRVTGLCGIPGTANALPVFGITAVGKAAQAPERPTHADQSYDELLKTYKEAELQRDHAARWYNQVLDGSHDFYARYEASVYAAQTSAKLMHIGAQMVVVARQAGADSQLGFQAIQRGVRTGTLAAHDARTLHKNVVSKFPENAALQNMQGAIAKIRRLLPDYVLEYGQPHDVELAKFLEEMMSDSYK